MDAIKVKFPSMLIPEDLFADEAVAQMVREARELLLAGSAGGRQA
jgi:hypothetical protein